MTTFNLAHARAAIRYHTDNQRSPIGDLAWSLADSLAEQITLNALQEQTIGWLRRDLATPERATAALTHKGGGHTPVIDLAITPDAPGSGVAEMQEISTALLDDYDRLEAALSVVVAIVDRAHLHGGGPNGGAPAPGTGCLPECRMCAELASIPKPLLDTARAINARIH